MSTERGREQIATALASRSSMQRFKTSDGVTLRYIDTAQIATIDSGRGPNKPWLIMIHGFTGSSAVFQKNIPTLYSKYRVIAPDLRGHGHSDKPQHGFQVSRLAMDIHEMIQHIQPISAFNNEKENIKAIGSSLGASILWCYASLFTTRIFTHMSLIDQSPLQNFSPYGPPGYKPWDHRFANRGMNDEAALHGLEHLLATDPEKAHMGTIEACLGYRYAPLPSDDASDLEVRFSQDSKFFLDIVMQGESEFYAKLMTNHTSNDWRDSVIANFGPGSGSTTKVLAVGSERSGCFPPAGVLSVVDFVNGGKKEGLARGKVVEWGGHWCYWEDPEKFNFLILDFLSS